ncbi:PREDICTED: putative fatty acyl-CoA reductase CG8306 [Wasmannia auropunctata]|uniref:putative fatty acyl-CoA reductase CG8306 n=1 Tax=Wasmannia auropunctata TaxID=64793 RepID=UPI0005EDBA1E|nr:PREDICTED: putative fatty acyl-CoA reductase CG8306 [Wasmannia auropunctata]
MLYSFAADSTFFVLNCTSQKYIPYGDSLKLSFNILKEEPIGKIFWTPRTLLTDNYTLLYILTILLHIMPAMFIDLILKFFGHRPMIVRLLRKVYVTNRAVSYFSFHKREYSNTNSLALISEIPSDNLDMFSFNYSCTDIRKYLKTSLCGIKKFILHEDINELDAIKAHNKRVSLLSTVVESIMFIGMLWMIYKWSYSYLL